MNALFHTCQVAPFLTFPDVVTVRELLIERLASRGEYSVPEGEAYEPF